MAQGNLSWSRVRADALGYRRERDGGFFVYILGQDAQMPGQLAAAFAAGNNGKMIAASLALIVGPSLVLWLVASWGQAWLRTKSAQNALQAAGREMT
jgi:hypothetical protein